MAPNLIGTVQSYRAEYNATAPFAANKPSGSDWGEKQLKWFGIDIKHDCSLQEIAPAGIYLLDSSKICTHIHKNLDTEWKDIEAVGIRVDRETFNGSLLNLLDPQDPIPDYATSVATSSSQATESQGPSPAPIARPMVPMLPMPNFVEQSATARAPAKIKQPVIASTKVPSRAEYDSHGVPVNRGTPSPSSSWSSSEPTSPSPFPRDRPAVDDNSSEAPLHFAPGPSQLAYGGLTAEKIRKLERDVEHTATQFLSIINGGIAAGAKDAIDRTYTK